ncbi:hypothetical protein K470DRAFT_277476 [Piedraia hortae CBS 480.64]|uniref:DUF1996 domain-containing protein n=1 Tax=Piedraia hortae CBS 480.64 TaxID=1314780 RepID=A0A6A7BXL6_9PEZI|nr:hypothetical protein K470DRAFT_277476 [Piedraia hortae CBS 480.64]
MRSLLRILALAGGANAFWRMPCRSQTGHGRLDPIANPGEVSPHVHTFHGGGGLGLTADYKSLSESNCTSCGVTQDRSAYWTPTLHFVSPNGTAVMVEQIGGMLAYYLYYLTNVTAFPEGFQMIAGDKNARSFDGQFPDEPLSYWPSDPSDQKFLQQRALGFNCLDYSKAPEASLYRHKMPTKEYMDANCPDGLRIELAFPSCGNGEKDSDDHRSHVRYPSLVKTGNCPDGFNVHYPFLFYETIWNTHAFAGMEGQFVLSNGDPTGCGYHGDFIMGWESSDFLQDALDTCQAESGEIEDCPLFDLQTDEDAAMCTFPVPPQVADDDVFGPCDGLPVDVPIQYGPQEATDYPVVGNSGVATTSRRHTPMPSTFTKGPTLSYSSASHTAHPDLPPTISPAHSEGGAKPTGGSHSDSGAMPTGGSEGRPSSHGSPSQAGSPGTPNGGHPESSPNDGNGNGGSPSAQSQGGPAQSYGGGHASGGYGNSPSPTAAPTMSGTNPEIIGTNYVTSGSDIVEIVIEQVDVTVTAVETAYVTAQKRHLHRHARDNRHVH